MNRFSPRVLTVSTPGQALAELERIAVDPGGLRMMSGKLLTRCIHLPKLQCRQANILKQEMLSLGGDAAVARGTVACSIKNNIFVKRKNIWSKLFPCAVLPCIVPPAV